MARQTHYVTVDTEDGICTHCGGTLYPVGQTARGEGPRGGFCTACFNKAAKKRRFAGLALGLAGAAGLLFCCALVRQAVAGGGKAGAGLIALLAAGALACMGGLFQFLAGKAYDPRLDCGVRAQTAYCAAARE